MHNLYLEDLPTEQACLPEAVAAIVVDLQTCWQDRCLLIPLFAINAYSRATVLPEQSHSSSQENHPGMMVLQHQACHLRSYRIVHGSGLQMPWEQQA